MNRLPLTLPLMLLPCLGCLEMDVKHREPHAAMRHADPAPSPSGGAITADQVTPENARDMAQALWDEFDREEVENDRQLLEASQPKR
jgi:hypothetical protein